MISPRHPLTHLVPVPHGGYHSTHPSHLQLLDFSANINPFGPSPRIWHAIHAVNVAQHPDPRATPLRHALADVHHLDPSMILVGNGTIDLIYHIAVAYVRPGDRVLIPSPTFGEYAAATTMMGATIVHFPITPLAHATLDDDSFVDTLQQSQPRLLFLCNPNNPTGSTIKHSTMIALLEAAPHTLIILDEAFVNFAAEPWDAIHLLSHYPNLLILRSMTKDYALTGLRVGYAIAAPPTIAALTAVQPPWSVNAFAQAAALVALADQHHLHTTLLQTRQATTTLRNALTTIGYTALPSAVHFFLLPIDNASQWQQRLLQHGVLVRDCTSFGLPNHLRIATRQPADMPALITALAACSEELCPHRPS